MSNTQKSIDIANASKEFNEIRSKLDGVKQTKRHQTKLRKHLYDISLKYGVRFEFMEKLLLIRNYK